MGTHQLVIETLISAGCNPFIKDNLGQTAYSYLLENHFEKKQLHEDLLDYM